MPTRSKSPKPRRSPSPKPRRSPSQDARIAADANKVFRGIMQQVRPTDAAPSELTVGTAPQPSLRSRCMAWIAGWIVRNLCTTLLIMLAFCMTLAFLLATQAVEFGEQSWYLSIIMQSDTYHEQVQLVMAAREMYNNTAVQCALPQIRNDHAFYDGCRKADEAFQMDPVKMYWAKSGKETLESLLPSRATVMQAGMICFQIPACRGAALDVLGSFWSVIRSLWGPAAAAQAMLHQ